MGLAQGLAGVHHGDGDGDGAGGAGGGVRLMLRVGREKVGRVVR